MPSPDDGSRSRTLLRARWRHIETRARKLALRGLAAVAADRLVSWGIDGFATPQRPSPPQDMSSSPPAPPGLPGERLAVTFRGQPLAVWGWGTGPTVVLTHGWSGHAGHMIDFVAPLVAAGRRVIAFDHPAHGSSGGARSHMLEFRDALLQVCRTVAPVASIVAHSLGATTTILALDRGLTDSLVPSSPPAPLVFIAPPLDPTWFARPFGEAVGLPEPVITAMLARLRAFVRADLGPRDVVTVARAQAGRPALFVHDRDDRATGFAAGQGLAAAWPRARFRATAGLGHRRILSDPAVIAEVVAFVTQPPPP